MRNLAIPERKIIWLLCLLAAVHVFIFSAAFPFFNNMDESAHFDLVVKYSHGHLPRGLEPIAEESWQYTQAFGSPEFFWPPEILPDGIYPAPFWHQSGLLSERTKRTEVFQRASKLWTSGKNLQASKNYESSQQPLYYVIAGLWWKGGSQLGLEGLSALYWLRFLNILFVVTLLWVGYFTAKFIFPENALIFLGTPALIAFLPQQAFYSIQNDMLSPICFGIVFIYLIKLLFSAQIKFQSGIILGLAIAATFLTKLSNTPLLAVAGTVVLLKMFQLHRAAKLHAFFNVFLIIFLCAIFPISAWLAWTKYAFGDFTGTADKIAFLTWTPKSFWEWWNHPIFSLNGFWSFISELLVAFWQGEFKWQGSPLDLPVPNAIYVVASLSFISLALANLTHAKVEQQSILLLSAALLVASAIFLGYISIHYDFGLCKSPSIEYPFLIAGRLMLGGLIPFLLLFLYGISSLFRSTKIWIQFAVLGAILLFMIISETITDLPIFSSQYNWYHM
jgi:hypothetical protein